MTVSLDNIDSSEAIGWADALLSRLAANSVGLNARLSLSTPPANSTVLSSTGYALTGSNASSMIDMAGTWNTTGTPTLIKANVTDTASNSASLLLDFQVGGSSRFSITKTGIIKTIPAPFIYDMALFGASGADGVFTIKDNVSVGGLDNVQLAAPRFSRGILFSPNGNVVSIANGTNAQKLRIYGTYTDASNYRRLTATMSASGVAEIKPVGAGTGASGNVLHISGLPTSNPGPGILWNNAGTPAIGT